MKRCARCDFVPTEDTDLPDHAASAGHPLCAVCTRSLTDAEPSVCESCLTETHTLLSGIVTMFDELPTHLGHLHGASTGPRTTDGRPLPGGNVLVMLSGGSEGLAEDGTTTREGDYPSVAFELGWWALAWADDRGDEALLGHTPARIVAKAGGYLERKMRWASLRPGFDQFHTDLRRIHRSLEHATGRSQPRQVAECECFDCGGQLERQWQAECRCGHRPDSQRLLNEETVADRDARLEAWDERHGKCIQGGYEDDWTCCRCGRKYRWAEYLLAMRGRLEERRVDLAPAPRRAEP